MASNADNVLKNFRWRVESISPTHQRPRKPFRWMDFDEIDTERHPVARVFQVRWMREDDLGSSVTDLVERRALHRYSLEVLYATDYDLATLQEIILQDRHDIIKALRDPRNLVGTSSTDSATDIGLQARRYVDARLETEAEIKMATLRLEFECEIWESE